MNTKENIQEVDYSEIDNKVEEIIEKANKFLKKTSKKEVQKQIKKAYEYAKEAHHGQLRLSWVPYLIHPVEATEFLLSLKPDLHTIQACLLHDVIEDTEKTAEEIEEIFWKEVRFLCEWMEKLWKVRYSWEDRVIWSLRKMFIAMAEDLRVIFIKLADRMHNMKTLKFHPKPEKRERIALETLNIYAPIADRLWLYHMKNFLEEYSFKTLEFDEYTRIKKELEELSDSIQIFQKHAKKEVEKLLLENNIKNFEIDYRVKSIYSIYKKLQKKNLDHVKTLYDFFGLRIIVKNETTCYKILWLIHQKWNPLPKRFKDYIALPKPNWYKSLHTTIIWLLKDYRRQPTEIQIKTYKMKEYSDIWIAAHFEYKEKWSVEAKDIDWVRELKDLVSDLENNDFVQSLRVDVFKDRIFVFTPKWDLVNLPAWSTPIDFAYYVHSDLWDHMNIAKINWVVKTLDKELHNWDIIEIITDKNKKPNPFRLSFVKTAKAKNRIKAYLKKENKDLYRERWKEILGKYLDKTWLFKLDKDLSILKNLDSRTYKIEERWQLVEQVGNLSTTPASIFRRILKAKNIKIEQEENNNIKNTENSKVVFNKKIIIWWDDNIDYILWACCHKKIPNKMVAHINREWKITIHKRDCEIIEKVNKDRLLSAYLEWEQDTNLEVSLSFTVLHKKWVLKEISDIIYIMDINIEEIVFKKTSKYKWDIMLILEIPDYDYLIVDRLIQRVKHNLKDKLVWFELKYLK